MKRRSRVAVTPSPGGLGENGAGTRSSRRLSARRDSLASQNEGMGGGVENEVKSPGFERRKKRRQSVGRRVSFADAATLESVREFIKEEEERRKEL